MPRTTLSFFFFATILIAAGPRPLSAAEPADELWQQADARIEKHRKADATIAVVDAAGKPVAGAKIEVRQTRHAFLFGCNIFLWGKTHDSRLEAAYRGRFAELLNYATLGFYWPSYEPRQGEPHHAYAEEVARWCREQGIAAKGHPLAWNYSDPRWLPDDAAEVRRLQLARIDNCVHRFAGLIDRWDVVNEATHFDRDDLLKKAPKMTQLWQKYGRVDFTRECFEQARRANSKATLLINDYRTEEDYARLIEQLVAKDGKPLYDVIGIQSHMHGSTWSNRRIWDVCERFSRFGVPLHFTETTILSGDPNHGHRGPSTPEGEAYQAREVVRFYTMLFSNPAVEALTWWDFSDLHAWQNAPAGFLRSDMSPKPAYEELKRLIKGKWWTRAELQSAADGTAGFRGFCGEYQITIRAAGHAPTVKQFQLNRGKADKWSITVQ